jgi:hypothetical protein
VVSHARAAGEAAARQPEALLGHRYLLAAEFRGRGYGSQAQQLLVRYLFAHTQVNRVEAITEAGNVAEQRALEGRVHPGGHPARPFVPARALPRRRDLPRAS